MFQHDLLASGEMRESHNQMTLLGRNGKIQLLLGDRGRCYFRQVRFFHKQALKTSMVNSTAITRETLNKCY